MILATHFDDTQLSLLLPQHHPHTLSRSPISVSPERHTPSFPTPPTYQQDGTEHPKFSYEQESTPRLSISGQSVLWQSRSLRSSHCSPVETRSIKFGECAKSWVAQVTGSTSRATVLAEVIGVMAPDSPASWAFHSLRWPLMPWTPFCKHPNGLLHSANLLLGA
jgi:hypothetical protein